MLALSKFRSWHEKCEANYPRLANSYAVRIYEVISSFESIAINYNNKAILSSVLSLPVSTCEPVIVIMNQMHPLLKSGLLWHCVDNFATPPASCLYFQQYIEWIPSVPTVQRSDIVTRVNIPRSNSPRGGSSRANQRDNSTVIPTIAANETGCIRTTCISSS